jgi:hypothetical protein
LNTRHAIATSDVLHGADLSAIEGVHEVAGRKLQRDGEDLGIGAMIFPSLPLHRLLNFLADLQ